MSGNKSLWASSKKVLGVWGQGKTISERLLLNLRIVLKSSHITCLMLNAAQRFNVLAVGLQVTLDSSSIL